VAQVVDVPQNTAFTRNVKHKAQAEDFALLLAEDAEHHFDTMIPATQDILSEAMAFLDEVGLDCIDRRRV
jgi:hypothetical protein